ncbi:MAG: orotate phosphoribosyltransferase [bacterium]
MNVMGHEAQLAVPHDQAVELLSGAGALLSGHFLLSSGLHSAQYFQCAPLMERPDIAERIACPIAAIVLRWRPDIVLSPALGAILFGYELSRSLGVRNIFAERPSGGRFELRRGFSLNEGERVIIAENVVTTGGSADEVAQMARNLGAKVVGYAIIVDRSGGRYAPADPVAAYAALDAQTFAPQDCPQCKAGTPLIKPGSRIFTNKQITSLPITQTRTPEMPITPMTTRERFNRIMHWQKPDRAPNMDFGYWDETIAEWHKQGLPESVKTGADVERHLGLEGMETILITPVWNGLYPWFQPETLEERADTRIVRDHEGNICEVSKHGASIPRYIKYGLETRQDWELLKRERLDYTREDRVGDVKTAVDNAHAAGMPIAFGCGSLYGWLRNWMGVENLSIAIIEEPAWVEEMMEHLTQMTLYLIGKALPGVEVDFGWWWEDMCYNNGPLLSPAMFERLMTPRYRTITDELKRYGIDVNLLDCDGSIYKLVPGWLKSGINCMFPIEAAHTDPVKLRESYGEQVLLVGGVNKVELARGKDAIDREIERLRPLVERGGYIPTVDHRVPPDVSYDNYIYYIEKKKTVL